MVPWITDGEALLIGLCDGKLDEELSWEEIAGHFIGRTLWECRRCYKILRPKPKEEAAKEKPWTADAEKRLVDMREKKGMAWNDLGRWFPGRT